MSGARPTLMQWPASVLAVLRSPTSPPASNTPLLCDGTAILASARTTLRNSPMLGSLLPCSRSVSVRGTLKFAGGRAKAFMAHVGFSDLTISTAGVKTGRAGGWKGADGSTFGKAVSFAVSTQTSTLRKMTMPLLQRIMSRERSMPMLGEDALIIKDMATPGDRSFGKGDTDTIEIESLGRSCATLRTVTDWLVVLEIWNTCLHTAPGSTAFRCSWVTYGVGHSRNVM